MARYEGTERRAEYGWHLKKELNVSHLLVTLTMAAGLFTWGMQMDSRMTRVETGQEALHQAASSAEQAVAARLNRIEDKLDRLIERQVSVR